MQKKMMRKLERYLNKKNFTINAEMTKIIEFRKGAGR